ncbi:twin-arginine translocase subunit TatC [Rickettsiales bacterium LUAb2]
MLFFKLKDHEKSLYKHINELRKHLLLVISYFMLIFIIAFYFSKNLYDVLASPLIAVLQNNNINTSFIITSLPEGFISYVKMSFFSSLFVSLPILLWQITLYLLPIIKYNSNRKFLIIATIIAPLLFYLGATFAYFFSFHVVFNFFIKFAIAKELGIYLKLSDYISLSLSIMVWIGIAFELPIILLVLNKLQILSYEQLKKARRISILIAFIIGAIITPPDPFSQIIMALILIFLYELSIFMIKLSK